MSEGITHGKIGTSADIGPGCIYHTREGDIEEEN